MRDQIIHYSLIDNELSLGSIKALLPLVGKSLRLRLLVDRSSIEVFADDGEISISRVFFFNSTDDHFSLVSEGGSVNVKSLVVNPVKSIWSETGLPR